MANHNGLRVCLIHGSTQSPHGWDLLVHELMAWGVDVTAVDLPLRSEGAGYFAREVARQVPDGKPPVVVAHGLAGLILPVVAEYLEVARLVYLAAMIPVPQASCALQPKWHGEEITNAAAREFLFHDCDKRIQDWALTTLRPWASPALIEELCPLRAFPEIPVTYISAVHDRTIDPAWWEHMAETTLGVTPLRIDCGHAPHVSRPREAARLIMGR